MLELLIVLFLIVLNAFFAMSEMALMTSRKLRLKQLAETSRGARTALALAEHPDNLLSTVQVGITLIGVLTGVFGGDAIGLIIAGWLEGLWPDAREYARPIGIGTAVGLITAAGTLGLFVVAALIAWLANDPALSAGLDVQFREFLAARGAEPKAVTEKAAGWPTATVTESLWTSRPRWMIAAASAGDRNRLVHDLGGAGRQARERSGDLRPLDADRSVGHRAGQSP